MKILTDGDRPPQRREVVLFKSETGEDVGVVIRFVDAKDLAEAGGMAPVPTPGREMTREELIAENLAGLQIIARAGVVEPEGFADSPAYEALPRQFKVKLANAIQAFMGIGVGEDAKAAESFPGPGSV